MLIKTHKLVRFFLAKLTEENIKNFSQKKIQIIARHFPYRLLQAVRKKSNKHYSPRIDVLITRYEEY